MFLKIVVLIAITLNTTSCIFQQNNVSSKKKRMQKDSMNLTEQEWSRILTPEQFRIIRQKGTEAPFSGKYNIHKENGIYVCAACGNELFSSEDKFDSHCGWPSFSDTFKNNNIKTLVDSGFGMIRTEIICAKCEGHLGHVFDDGPAPTKLRYCVNSVSIEFIKK